MKKTSLFIVAVILVALAAGCQPAAPTAAPKPEDGSPAAEATRAPVVISGNTVVAEARVVPAKWAALSMPVGGVVSNVAVAEGNQVTANQVLLQLNSARLKAAVAQAEAAVKRAQAKLDQLKAGSRKQEIAIAEAQLAAAQAALAKLQSGADASQVATARAELENAQAQVRQAQAAYDQIKWQPGGEASPQAYQLQIATNNAIAAKGRLDALTQGPKPAELSAAQAEIRRWEAELSLVRAGSRPEEIVAAEADLAAQKAALDEANAALADAELKAPFAGTVSTLTAKRGEYLTPGTPALVLADLSDWRIETTDLTELSIARVQEGSPATVTFDAIPDLKLSGKVERIRATGEEKRGDIVYTAIIKLDKLDPRLRWNMTASVSIKLK